MNSFDTKEFLLREPKDKERSGGGGGGAGVIEGCNYQILKVYFGQFRGRM